MKKHLSILLVLLLALSLSACGQKEASSDSMNVTSAPTASTASTASENVSATATPVSAVVFDAEKAVTDYFINMPKHIYKIPEKDFVEMVKAGENMTIIDIRSAKDYAEGHIKGAANLPWGSSISEGLSSIPKDKPLMVYCYTGQTAGQTVVTLRMAGFDARSVNLGWNFGISKVEGADALTTTEETKLTPGITTIEPEVQNVMDAYYKGLETIADPRFKNYKISEADLKALVDAKDEGIYILSVRSAKDYAEGHIEGASNIPFENAMAPALMQLPKDKKIVVYCYTGQTAGQVTAALRLMGYDAISLNGGMGMEANKPMGWINQSYPVVK